MKFSKYIETHQRQEWAEHYIKYTDLKKQLQSIAASDEDLEPTDWQSLSFNNPAANPHVSLGSQQHFYLDLVNQVAGVDAFTQSQAQRLRDGLRALEGDIRSQRRQQASAGPLPDGWAAAVEEAQRLGQEYLALEKFVNLNYAGFQKILKKHDKLLPGVPCWAFFRRRLSQQSWVRGDHHDIQVTLARVFTDLHAAQQDASSLNRGAQGPSPSGAMLSSMAAGTTPGITVTPQGSASLGIAAPGMAGTVEGASAGSTAPPLVQSNFIETARKFWVRQEHLAELQYEVLQRLPLAGPPAPPQTPKQPATTPKSTGAQAAAPPADTCGDPSVVNLLYLDNRSLELYHNLLYGRPYSAMVRLRWRGTGPAPPSAVQVQRKVYREGWRPGTSVKDSFPVPETRTSGFLSGRWNFTDARKYLLLSDSRAEPSHIFGRPSRPPGPGDWQHSQRAYLSLAEEMEATQREYALFKTFTEVQRLVETKALQPVVRISFQQTVFAESKERMRARQQEGSTEPSVVKLQLDNHIRALLEYSYDGQTRIANGLWRQAHHTDAVDFPYACVKIHVSNSADMAHTNRFQPPPLPDWVQRLVDRGMLVEMEEFSKFLFGCAGLLPDMVRAVPVWIDDPLVQRCLASEFLPDAMNQQAFPTELGGLHARGAPATANPLLSKLASSSKRLGAATMAGVRGSEAGMDQLPDLLQSAGKATGSEGIKGWQLKLLSRQQAVGSAYAPQAKFVETTEVSHNEKVFVLWLSMAVTLSGLSCLLLGFAASASKDLNKTVPFQLVEVTSLFLLAGAIVAAGFSITTYCMRTSLAAERGAEPPRYSSRGTLVLTALWSAALVVLVALNVFDLISLAHSHTHHDGGGDDPGDAGGGIDYGSYSPAPAPAPSEPDASLISATHLHTVLGRYGLR